MPRILFILGIFVLKNKKKKKRRFLCRLFKNNYNNIFNRKNKILILFFYTKIFHINQVFPHYFIKFGYKILETKIPNITDRQYWNYVKISQDDNIDFGSVSLKFMEIINNVCRRETTVWHNHSNIGDYSLNNIII